MRTGFKVVLASASVVAIAGAVAIGVADGSDDRTSGGPFPSSGTYAQAPTKVWDLAMPGHFPQVIAINDSQVVFGSKRNEAGKTALVAMDMASGTELWNRQMPAADCGTGSFVHYTLDSAVVACVDLGSGTITTFDTASGEVLGTAETSGISGGDKSMKGPSVHVQGDSIAVCDRASMSAVLRYGPANDLDSGWKIEIPASAPEGCRATIAGTWVAADGYSGPEDDDDPWMIVTDLDGATQFESFTVSGDLRSEGRIVSSAAPRNKYGGYNILDVHGEKLFQTETADSFFPRFSDSDMNPYYITRTGDIHSLEDNRYLWTLDGPTPFHPSIDAAGNLLFVEDFVRLSAYDIETGERQWSRALDQLARPGTSKFEVERLFSGYNGRFADGRYVIGATDAETIGIDAESGELAWSIPAGGELSDRFGAYMITRRSLDENNEEFPGAVFTSYRFKE